MKLQEAHERADKRKTGARVAYARAAGTRGEEAAAHKRRGERMEEEARRLIRESK